MQHMERQRLYNKVKVTIYLHNNIAVRLCGWSVLGAPN